MLIFHNEADYDPELTLDWLERTDELLGQVRVNDVTITVALADIGTDIGNAAVTVSETAERGAVTSSRNDGPQLIQLVAATEQELFSVFRID